MLRLNPCFAPGTTATPGHRCVRALALGAVLLLALAAPGGPGPATARALECPADKELCVQAERSGGIDLKTGVAHLEGNVQGVVRSRALEFSGHSLTAFRNGGQEWVRLVLEDNVQLRQADRRSVSDHGVLEREEIRLTGNVRIDQTDLVIEGHEAVIHSEPARTVVHGLPDAPLSVVLNRALLAEEDTATAVTPPPAPAPSDAAVSARDGNGEGPPPAVVTTVLRALKAVVEEAPRRVVLTGDVHVEQSDERLQIDAQQVTLFFTPDAELESFRAEGDVVIGQPERHITADFAQSRNALRTLLLVGNATMQQKGQFDLKSDRMEVFVDATKGVMQSQDRKPITLSMDVGGTTTYGLSRQSLLSLSGEGVPATTVEKLTPLVGRRFDTRAELRQAVSGRLTAPEARRYLDTVLATVP